MSVTERFRQPGSWSIKLSDACPVSVRQQLAFGGHIVITPTHVRPGAVGDAAILAMARYTGVLLRRKRAMTELAGQGLAFWMGTDDRGDLIEAPISFTNGTLADWIGALCPTNDLTVGTVTSPGGTLTWSVVFTQRFRAIEWVCDYFGVDWRVNPNGTLDVGPNLFVTTPTCIAQRKGGGAEIMIRGLKVEDLELDEDIETLATRVVLLGEGEASSVAVGAADAPATPYKGFKGNAVKFARLVDASETPAGAESTVAAKALAQYAASHPALALATDTYDIGGKAKPGDPMWVFDQLEGLVDTANEVPFRGQKLHPAKLRVYGYTWPVEGGMGVLFRYYLAGVVTYVDLTEWMVWETGSTRFEVGGERRISTGSRGAIGNVSIERADRPDAPPAGTISHNDLTGVTANQHHAQAHAIGGADHTGSLGHAALSGVTANQHHNQSHTDADHSDGANVKTAAHTKAAHDALALSHDSLADVSANDHHAQAHAIGGGDHTGTLAHSALGSVGTDDHHAKLHVHSGDGSGTVDHGTLAGLGDDDHTQYILKSLFDGKGDLIGASADNTPARVSVGSNGQVLLADSSTAAGLAWGSPAASTLTGVGRVKAASKSADESVTSSVVYQADDHLLFAAAANEIYVITYYLLCEGATAGDITFSITIPSGTVDWGPHPGETPYWNAMNAGTTPNALLNAGGGWAVGLAGAGVKVGVVLQAIFVNGATPGNVVLNWTQNVSNATATKVLKGSSLIATRTG